MVISRWWIVGVVFSSLVWYGFIMAVGEIIEYFRG